MVSLASKVRSFESQDQGTCRGWLAGRLSGATIDYDSLAILTDLGLVPKPRVVSQQGLWAHISITLGEEERKELRAEPAVLAPPSRTASL